MFVAPVGERERDVQNGGYFITILAAGIFLLLSFDSRLVEAERSTVPGRREA